MTPTDSTQITLSQGQRDALTAFNGFICDPEEAVFVLEGYSGCGKSTLVSHLLDKLPLFLKTAKLIDPKMPDYEVQLTATTNKAAESLAHLSGMGVITIHSFLGLIPFTDYKTRTSTLTIKRGAAVQEHFILFIDEASYIDSQMLGLIFKMTKNCKIVFIGDPAQLTPINSSTAPVFNAGFPTAKLTEVMRQAEGNPIIELSTKFRHTVNTGEWQSFKPDGVHIQRVNRNDFENLILSEFTRPDWKYHDSKVLAWTNKCVINYNNAIRSHVSGDPEFQAGDYAICNSFVQLNRGSIKTDQTVYITDIYDATELDVKGKYVTIEGSRIFMPDHLADKNARMKLAKAEDNWDHMRIIDNWIDLRAAYAQTVNKSQGSTYTRVFIDLDDIRRCNSGNQIARLLYVAVSRAKLQVFLTGDLI